MVTVDSLPKCFGVHEPVAGNDCRKCVVRDFCGKVVLKSDLKPVLEIVERMERTIRGG